VKEVKLLLNKEREKAEALEKEREGLLTEKQEMFDRMKQIQSQVSANGSSSGGVGSFFGWGSGGSNAKDKKIVEALSNRSQALEVNQWRRE